MPQGLKAPRAVAIVVALVAWLAACGAYSSDIEAVKQSNVPTGIVNEELVKQFAGARGKATWSAERPEKYKDNENITAILWAGLPGMMDHNRAYSVHTLTLNR